MLGCPDCELLQDSRELEGLAGLEMLELVVEAMLRLNFDWDLRIVRRRTVEVTSAPRVEWKGKIKRRSVEKTLFLQSKRPKVDKTVGTHQRESN
jgi:hypothetical protein